MRFISLYLLSFLLLLSGISYATVAGVSVSCIYFTKSTEAGSPTDDFYSGHWSNWLRVYRAIKKKPDLQKALLKLPKDSYQVRKGAIPLIHKTLTNHFIRQQPNHVYVLQLGIYKSRKGADRFLKFYAPKIVLRGYSLYQKIPKDLKFEGDSERGGNYTSLFALPSTWKNQRVARVCYGIYASHSDAKRDGVELQKRLGYSPVIIQRNLTAQLTNAYMFAPLGSMDFDEVREFVSNQKLLKQ